MDLKDFGSTLNQLLGSLKISTIFPAALLVLVNAYLVVPQALCNFEPGSIISIGGIIAVTLVVSYVLYVIRQALTSIFMGEGLRETDVGILMLKRQIDKYNLLLEKNKRLHKRRTYLLNQKELSAEEQWKELNRLNGDLWDVNIRLNRRFPPMDMGLSPTKLGNIFKAFQAYPSTRYGMDFEALWPRLTQIIQEDSRLDFVTQEKDAFDFLQNTCTVVALIGLELLHLYLYLGNLLVAFVIIVSTVILCWLLYEGMAVAADNLGTAVRTAFDLYRHHIWQRLALVPTSNAEKEYDRWNKLSQFFLFQPLTHGFLGFQSELRLHNLRNSGKKIHSSEDSGPVIK